MRFCPLLLIFILTFVALRARADSIPFTAFEGPDRFVAPPASMRFQKQLSNDPNYAESWFVIMQGNDAPRDSEAAPALPTQMFVMFSVTNLGPGGMRSTVNAYYRPAGGKVTRLNEEFSEDHIRPASSTTTATLGIALGPHAIEGAPPRTTVRLRGKKMQADLVLENRLPPFQMRNGTIDFGAERNTRWTLCVPAPRARITGTVTVDGKTVAINGLGYMDHTSTNARVPDTFSHSNIIRVWHDDLTFLLHDISLAEEHGDAKTGFAMLARDGTILTATDDFACTTTALRPVPDAPHPRPEGFRIDVANGPYRIRGTVRVTQVFQNEDVLANLSWPVRVAIKTLYAKPWLFRMRGDYDLQIDLSGETRHIRGNALLVTVYY